MISDTSKADRDRLAAMKGPTYTIIKADLKEEFFASLQLGDFSGRRPFQVLIEQAPNVGVQSLNLLINSAARKSEDCNLVWSFQAVAMCSGRWKHVEGTIDFTPRLRERGVINLRPLCKCRSCSKQYYTGVQICQNCGGPMDIIQNQEL